MRRAGTNGGGHGSERQSRQNERFPTADVRRSQQTVSASANPIVAPAAVAGLFIARVHRLANVKEYPVLKTTLSLSSCVSDKNWAHQTLQGNDLRL